LFGVVSGGLKRGTTALDNLDIITTFDNEKLLGIKGNSVLIHFLNNNGGEPNGRYAGTLQGINNIEVTTQTAKVLEAFVQQNFWDDRVSFLAGLYDLNREFYVNDSAGLFIGSTFGIGNEFAASGQNGPSVFPTTSLAFRTQVKPTPQTYLLAAILDGVPGDPGDPHGTQVSLGHGDGALLVAEVGFAPEAKDRAFGGKYAVGAWRYTQKLDDVRDVDGGGDPIPRRSQGIYFLVEAPLYREKEKGDEGLVAFFRIGFSDGDTTAFDYSWSAGAVYTGLIPGRDSGKLGFGISQAGLTDKFRDASATAGKPLDSQEFGIELTYRDDVFPGVALQPNVQYFINPGADPALSNVLVVGLRLELSF
jgi:porin